MFNLNQPYSPITMELSSYPYQSKGIKTFVDLNLCKHPWLKLGFVGIIFCKWWVIKFSGNKLLWTPNILGKDSNIIFVLPLSFCHLWPNYWRWMLLSRKILRYKLSRCSKSYKFGRFKLLQMAWQLKLYKYELLRTSKKFAKVSICKMFCQ